VALADGSLYATYRTIDGYPCAAISRDRGATWTGPSYMTYEPGGARRIKHSRAANFVKKFSNGKYLYWFHNHGGEPSQADPAWEPYAGRNPVWVCGGVERDGGIAWSEPEILLYDDDPKVRMSYPDFPEPMGVFRDVEKPIYDEQVSQQVELAIKKHGEGNFDALFNSGDTWTVE